MRSAERESSKKDPESAQTISPFGSSNLDIDSVINPMRQTHISLESKTHSSQSSLMIIPYAFHEPYITNCVYIVAPSHSSRHRLYQHIYHTWHNNLEEEEEEEEKYEKSANISISSQLPR